MLNRIAYCAFALLGISGVAHALEIGFEGTLSLEASDNITTEDVGAEEDGQTAIGRLSIFGDQSGTKVRGGFIGEVSSERVISDPDSNYTGFTQFIGAAEFQVTPRSFTWYLGDVLGTVSDEDGVQDIDNFADERRNVFVTGPRFTYNIDSFSTVDMRFLYVLQTQDDVTLEQLFNTTASWSVDTSTGNTWGLSLSNIYTDNPETNLEGDFNRLSLSGTWNRERGRNRYDASFGGTRYDTETDSLNGLNARFSYRRQLSTATRFGITLSRDLTDQTLNVVEDLFSQGTARLADGDGFFDDTRLDVSYEISSPSTSLDFVAGIAYADFRLLADSTGFTDSGDREDRTNANAGVLFAHSFSSRTRFGAGLSYSQQDFINRDENAQSVLADLSIAQRLSRSFEISLAYRGVVADGSRIGLDGSLEDFEIVENRATINLVWAPPTRASKDLAFELSSLLR